MWASIHKNDLARPMVARSEQALLALAQGQGPAAPAVRILEYGDYPNLYGDLSANSGNNMLSRGFPATPSAQAAVRQRLRLQRRPRRWREPGDNPAAARLAGKCVARETLTVLKRSAPAEIFRKITCDNARALLKN